MDTATRQLTRKELQRPFLKIAAEDRVLIKKRLS